MANVDLKKYGLESVNSTPDYKSYGLELGGDVPASDQLIYQANQQGDKPESYKPQLQEEFSNPTQWPGFEKLSPEEQRQRISWSTTDPANQTATGGFLPGGAYESPITRGAASFIPTLAAPQLKGGVSGITGIINALNRVGAGAIGNIAYESPNIKTFEQLKSVGGESAIRNLFLEGLPILTRGISGASEIYNPSYNFAKQKMNEIANEYSASKSLQRETYRPVFEKYGTQDVTSNPEKYLRNAGISSKKLYPESKKIYDEFLEKPTFQNLHNLQSVIGKDLRTVSRDTTKPLTKQRFTQYRNNLQDLAKDFISIDENALGKYNLGSQITKNLVEPFRSTPTLRKISYGTKINPEPIQIANAIKNGREKIAYESGGNVFTAIPKGHPLEKHMNHINTRMDIGNSMQKLVPEFSKKVLPNLVGAIQNKTIGNVFKNLDPAYYIGGRAAISQIPYDEIKGR
jgi:hypothetical protein